MQDMRGYNPINEVIALTDRQNNMSSMGSKNIYYGEQKPIAMPIAMPAPIIPIIIPEKTPMTDGRHIEGANGSSFYINSGDGLASQAVENKNNKIVAVTTKAEANTEERIYSLLSKEKDLLEKYRKELMGLDSKRYSEVGGIRSSKEFKGNARSNKIKQCNEKYNKREIKLKKGIAKCKSCINHYESQISIRRKI